MEVGPYRYESNFPTFAAVAAAAASDPNNPNPSHNLTEMDFDFNILSEYLFTEEDKLTPWIYSQEDALRSMSPMDNSDHEEHSSSDEADSKKRKLSGTDGKSKNQDQIDRRRERNRVLARKTRLRKKFFFESLQKQVSQLATENELLKNVIRQRMSNELKTQILSECKTFELPNVVTNSTVAATSLLERADFSLMQAIQAAQRSFVISDPSLPDNPIIFASKGFLDLCGYKLEEVLGRNCRFLQGPNTDAKQVEIMRNGIMKGEDVSVCLLNYRADGSQFYNQIFVAALRDSSNKIINYVGVQVEIKQDRKMITAENESSSSVSTTVYSSQSKQVVARKQRVPTIAAANPVLPSSSNKAITPTSRSSGTK